MTPDPALARQLYEEAYDAGSSAAAFFLGHRLHIGDGELGIDADGDRALQLMRRASAQVICDFSLIVGRCARFYDLVALPFLPPTCAMVCTGWNQRARNEPAIRLLWA